MIVYLYFKDRTNIENWEKKAYALFLLHLKILF